MHIAHLPHRIFIFLHGLPDRVRGYFASRSPRYLLGGVGVALCIFVLAAPSPFVIETPGPTRNVLGEVGGDPMIRVTGHVTHDDGGSLLLTTVNARGVPGYPVTSAEMIWSWFDPHAVVIPREVVFPPGQSRQEYQRQSTEQMSESQRTAIDQAMRYASRHGVDTSGVDIRMHVDEIGGPSAGLMYTLGAIDKLTSQRESGGQKIAGTGTMDGRGAVGAIGGIRLKMLGARRDGAAWFLAPKANCSEVVGHVPEGLRDVAVGTLDDAYQALVAIGEGRGSALPRCTAV